MSVPASPFQALPRRSLAEGVTDQIRRAILNADLPEGAAVAEAHLAAKLDVSRGPVREALVQLEREGLVVFDPRGRCRVRTLTVEDFEELSGLRLQLESMSVELAAKKLDAADRAALEDNLARCAAAATLADLGHLDLEFHDLVMRAARHQRLLACWQTIASQVEWWILRNYRRHAGGEKSARALVLKSQRDLYDAIRSGNPKRAVAEIRTHVDRWCEINP